MSSNDANNVNPKRHPKIIIYQSVSSGNALDKCVRALFIPVVRPASKNSPRLLSYAKQFVESINKLESFFLPEYKLRIRLL